jgi:hypothetical protein
MADSRRSIPSKKGDPPIELKAPVVELTVNAEIPTEVAV